jgi:hypothetical protein
MEHKRLDFIKCECGKEISLRALARHLRSDRFVHSDKYKEYSIELIDIAKINKRAWLISEGTDAERDEHWCFKVLVCINKLEEFTFKSPRSTGQMTSRGAKKLSEERIGRENPSVKNNPAYDIEKIKEFALSVFNELECVEDPRKFKKLETKLDLKFPAYRYSFAGMFEFHGGQRGHNRRNFILSYLLERSVEWIISEKALDRGKFIKIGQQKSSKFKIIQNAGRKGLRGHVTIPHNTLLNMILSVDPEAIKEKQIDYESTWKSYDIFSPKLNTLIEMHGHVWHNLNKCKLKMVTLVEENVKNDKIKVLLAESNGYKLEIFWDDQTDKWEEQIEKLYGKRSKSYEQALREEINKKRERRSI